MSDIAIDYVKLFNWHAFWLSTRKYYPGKLCSCEECVRKRKPPTNTDRAITDE